MATRPRLKEREPLTYGGHRSPYLIMTQVTDIIPNDEPCLKNIIGAVDKILEDATWKAPEELPWAIWKELSAVLSHYLCDKTGAWVDQIREIYNGKATMIEPESSDSE